jgi:hypothetical protein
MKKRFLSLALCSSLIVAGPSTLAAAPTDGIAFSDPLDRITLQNGTEKRFDVGIGSGACRLRSDPEGVIYTITDRGPNIKTKDAKKLMGVDFGKKKGKIFPTPNFAPTIYKLEVKDGGVTVLDKIQIKRADGTQISGISNPGTEAAWNINGKRLAYDPAGLDAEGIVKLKDGTFWIGEEYGPSILHVAADGRVVERWVPKGVEASLEGAGYEIKEILPEILRKRSLNRGIESMAASPCEKYLYFAMQSPLANPDKDTYKKSRNLRIFKIDNEAGKVVGEYVYVIDTPDTFAMDNKKKLRKQNDVKISELTAVAADKLVVLERISKTTKFYFVDLTAADNILGSNWDDVATSPSLEQSDASQIKVLQKNLLLNTDDLGGLMKKIEGLAWLGGDQWIMVNDNDFGIANDPTYVVPVKMAIE